jgi:hypothetical protein
MDNGVLSRVGCSVSHVFQSTFLFEISWEGDQMFLFLKSTGGEIGRPEIGIQDVEALKIRRACIPLTNQRLTTTAIPFKPPQTTS